MQDEAGNGAHAAEIALLKRRHTSITEELARIVADIRELKETHRMHSSELGGYLAHLGKGVATMEERLYGMEKTLERVDKQTAPRATARRKPQRR
jgi:uncharacterized protein YPO0396